MLGVDLAADSTLTKEENMCVMSVVSDHWNNEFPNTWTTGSVLPPGVDLNELRKLIDEFKEAMEAAKKIDILMKQPNCVDPEKSKLEQRVAALEKLLAKKRKKS